jgi:hypothetical protein
MLRNEREKALQVSDGKPIRRFLFQMFASQIQDEYPTLARPVELYLIIPARSLRQSIIPEALTRQYAQEDYDRRRAQTEEAYSGKIC